MGLSSKRYEVEDLQAAQEFYHSRNWTDGLPVVIPTPERVQRLVLASGLDADIELGEPGPGSHAWTMDLTRGTYIFDVGPEDFMTTGLWRFWP